MIATNNGSFPWRGSAGAADLEEAKRLNRARGSPAETLRPLQDRVTREAIDAQVGAGLDLITDGLVRRGDPVSYLAGPIEGVSLGEERPGFPGNGAAYSVPVIRSEVSWKGPILCEDFLFASRGSPRPVKVVLTGPYTLARVAEDRAYGDPMALAMGLATVLNQELRALQQAGAGFLQVNEPAILDHREDFPIFTRIWEVLGRGVGATLCLHLEGGDLAGLYPGIARLKRLGCLSLDCVAGRASLELLGAAPIPESLRLGIGLVDGSNPEPESTGALVDALRAVTGLPPHERILLGTASDLGNLEPAVAAEKLRNLAAAARMLTA